MNLFIKTIKKTSLLSHSCLFIPHSVRKNILKMEIGGKKTTTHKAIVNKPSFQSQIEQKTQNTHEAPKKQRKKA
ncbi:1-deoxy-D-xylulose 5-phosphate reductoisomerase [Vibrio cholerae]|uniref:1-deoxy-D-xylulose 5-phosphate reductoisomerase n=1 Tax=Vibrio cholerae TaxID=666 RepID=UPI000E0A79CF|nr:1-deoxy-D-xylulose 5-phosphate reductoisomerase [Vibrio cholerae]EHY0953626.1 1-deoxy-D-xylulose 5-phosphate reductoisomerase [Vibrio cholerae]EJL6599479.1 1-deoxy-D-xylulose 5-phosphate reductoisomerase [Vibrio cholerae]EJL6908747.1 1-deoxy-D-xylulose 5-phosphate reductoisomerase [Vibrio cholerae]EJY0884038.1 1-deoxy-D-xylulose 5-phosphate reductoisomerase [Vibrio cholerae]EKF9119919.1 1-deoxy-D-xylulose 5-phosphate reductoisomerase [Vibrio cholerae]